MKGTLRERFYRRVLKQPSGCWEWQGYCHPTRGYGQMGRGKRWEGLVETHRLAWELANGPIPSGMSVCHKCDNPPCVNVDHLFLGTHQENMADKKAKGRARGAQGTRSPFAKLTFWQVEEIRSRRVPGRGGNTRALAAEFGISAQYVGQLAARRWRKVA